MSSAEPAPRPPPPTRSLEQAQKAQKNWWSYRTCHMGMKCIEWNIPLEHTVYYMLYMICTEKAILYYYGAYLLVCCISISSLLSRISDLPEISELSPLHRPKASPPEWWATCMQRFKLYSWMFVKHFIPLAVVPFGKASVRKVLPICACDHYMVLTNPLKVGVQKDLPICACDCYMALPLATPLPSYLETPNLCI